MILQNAFSYISNLVCTHIIFLDKYGIKTISIVLIKYVE